MLTPIGVHVLIEPIDRQENRSFRVVGKSEGVPDRGILRAVGNGVESETLKDSLGKVVVYRQHADEKFEFDGVSYHLIEEQDIMGVYEAEGNKVKAKAQR